MPSRHSSRSGSLNGQIDALDFDANRKASSQITDTSSESNPPALLRDDESLLSNVVDGIIQKDRRKIKTQVSRYLSYASAILSWSVFRYSIIA